jgi:PST family polysaccharide transporter
MSLKRAASLGVVQSAVSVAASFLSVKITSVYLGPAGIGLLGQLQNFMTMSMGIVASGLSTAVVRRTAQYSTDPQARATVVSTVMRLVVFGGLPAAAVIALGSSWLATELLHDGTLFLPVLLFALVYVVGLLGPLLTGTANGARDYRTVTLIQIGAALSSLLLFAALCPILGVLGGLVAAAVAPAATAAIAWLLVRRRSWWPVRPMSHGFSSAEARTALGFVPLAATSALAQPMVQILIRDSLARSSGMSAVGMLHGVVRLSDLYVNIATSVLGMYFVPRFSEVQQSTVLKREIRKGLITLVPAVAGAGLLLWLLRDLVVRLVFTAEFSGMRDLFAWQVVGNVLKVTGWFFAHLIVAKGSPIAMAGFELLMGLFWWAAGVYLVSRNGAVGATQAYALNYAIYVCVAACAVVVILRRVVARERRGVSA